MRFKDFLKEAKHRKELSLVEAEALLRHECKDALSFFDAPLWRGFGGDADAYLVQAEVSERSSANTSNHYTVIMDEFLPKLGYPRRGASIICANNENESGARGFGRLYAIFPYDGVKIGVCSGDDLWTTRFNLGDSRREKRIDIWNDFFRDADIPDYSYEDLVQGIKDTLDNPEDDHYNLVEEIFHTSDEVEGILKKAYSPESLGLHLATTKDINKYNDKPRELWIGGKCVALSKLAWRKLMVKFGHPDPEGDDDE